MTPSTPPNLRVPPVLHSLRYLSVAVSEPSPGVPKYLLMGFVDGIPFVRYDSERGRREPLTQWVKDGVKPEYWEGQTQRDVRSQHVDARDLEILRERYNQSGGLQGAEMMILGLHVKHECPEWLQKYVGYGQRELERKEPPDVHVSGKEEHGTLILSCHAYGFYPSTIAVSWMKGDDTLDQGPEWGGIVPNSDGTFHTWARIEALPEERELYRCRVEHPGMLEPGIFAWEPTSGGNLTVVVAVSVVAAILILTVLIGFTVWRLQSGRRDRNGHNPAAGRDVGTNSSSTGITA
ncbi:class I histocompatibility antigen, F10 alpha chain-like [Passer montanus]|uniref:class I histocompatibility antigen, F10 alpha chain-like n=1 Tax=Passer montanus TaxID=9160 RepID=UPI001961AFCF|nr:class I histocompatibility antigen, F10 alpha chain-like [Passer montanus]